MNRDKRKRILIIEAGHLANTDRLTKKVEQDNATVRHAALLNHARHSAANTSRHTLHVISVKAHPVRNRRHHQRSMAGNSAINGREREITLVEIPHQQRRPSRLCAYTPRTHRKQFNLKLTQRANRITTIAHVETTKVVTDLKAATGT